VHELVIVETGHIDAQFIHEDLKHTKSSGMRPCVTGLSRYWQFKGMQFLHLQGQAV